MKSGRQRSRIISYELIMTDAELGVEVYANRTGHAVMAFSGKRSKPDFHHRFSNPEEALCYVVTWHDRLRAIAKEKSIRKQPGNGSSTTLAAKVVAPLYDRNPADCCALARSVTDGYPGGCPVFRRIAAVDSLKCPNEAAPTDIAHGTGNLLNC